MLQSSANLTRSQRNLQWVKSKFKSLKSNLHEASVQVFYMFYRYFFHSYIFLIPFWLSVFSRSGYLYYYFCVIDIIIYLIPNAHHKAVIMRPLLSFFCCPDQQIKSIKSKIPKIKQSTNLFYIKIQSQKVLNCFFLFNFSYTRVQRTAFATRTSTSGSFRPRISPIIRNTKQRRNGGRFSLSTTKLLICKL